MNQQTDPALFASRLQHLLIPSIMPAGLDPHQIIDERDPYIEARMQQQNRELSSLPSTMGDDSFDSVRGGMMKENKRMTRSY